MRERVAELIRRGGPDMLAGVALVAIGALALLVALVLKIA